MKPLFLYPKTAIGHFSSSFLNPKNEITNAVMGQNAFAWTLDNIGNRQTSSNNTEALSYAVNSLNQYTNISDGVTVTPRYDLDGNLTNYGAFAFAWDGDNRLASVSSNGTLVASFKYDYMSRRYEKVVGSITNTFIWDGWNCIAEINSATGNTNCFVWGLDISRSLQDAGGVGGLLSTIHNDGTYFPCADANGNISDYVATNGAVAAHYEYDPYGNTTAKTGPQADTFTFRFSSKYLDQESGLYYYGYRMYSPMLGRWMSRDLLAENEGGLNRYAMCGNNGVNNFDSFGEVGYYFAPEYAGLDAGVSWYVDSWNETIRENIIRLAVLYGTAENADSITYGWKKTGNPFASEDSDWSEESVSKDVFWNRVFDDKVESVPTPGRSLAGEVSFVKDHIKSLHKNSWDNSVYWAHSEEDNKIHYQTPAGGFELVWEMNRIRPTIGYFNNAATCRWSTGAW